MNKEVITKLKNSLEQAAHRDENEVEFWYAREIQELLEYSEWRNFNLVIDKAKIACANARGIVMSHFVEINKTVQSGMGKAKDIIDFKLSRYACYLIAQNGDSKKEPVAFAQSYFALQTRKQELIEERIEKMERLKARQKLTQTEKELSETLYEHGVDEKGFGIVRSKGDEALFGGNTTQQMKQKLKVPQPRALADFVPTVTIKARDLAAEMTRFNVVQEGLEAVPEITEEHVSNNNNVRGALVKSKIFPENLPAAIDIKKIEKEIKNEEKEALTTGVKKIGRKK